MMKAIWLLLVPILVALTGCYTAPKKQKYRDAAYLTYRLPVTAARVNMDLTLMQCQPTVKARALITVAPVVLASSFHQFTIDGSQLASFTKKREVDISLYPIGTIKSVNSSVSDRTGAIMLNAIKIIGTLGMLDVQETAAGGCNLDTEAQLGRVAEIKDIIQKLRDQLNSGSRVDPVATQKLIDAWASELGRIQSENLFVSVKRDILFPEKKIETGGTIEWKNSDFRKWFSGTADEKVSNFRLGWCISPAGPEDVTCSAQELQRYNSADVPPATIECKEDGTDCSGTLVFREPADAVLTLIAYGDDFVGVGRDMEVAQIRLPVAQWGELSYFDFSARFGESKTVSLSFDEYGRRTSFGWKSGARGEEITGGLQSLADAASTLSTSQKGQQLKGQKAEIETLETQQKLNKLRHCQAVIEAGGFVCPDQ